MSRTLRRKPRTPFPYVLEQDRELEQAEQPRFIIKPPSGQEWAEICDAGGNGTILFESVRRCVERLDNHEDAGAFGAAGSAERQAYLDELDVQVLRELGNAVANTMLAETDRKN